MNKTLSSPVVMLEGDLMALHYINDLEEKGIPVVYSVKNNTLYTDTEDNASKARHYILQKNKTS